MKAFELLPRGQALHPAHLAQSIGQVPALASHPLSHARVVFLVVLVVFFCTLFIGAYVWMRRPSFGQVGGPTTKPEESAPVPGE
jgi:hypothetical protein